MDAFTVIQRPVVSEKSYALVQRERTYIFEINPRASKHQVREAVEKLFDVKVESVRTAHVRGKERRLRMHLGRTRSWKKAYVRLTPQSKTIELF